MVQRSLRITPILTLFTALIATSSQSVEIPQLHDLKSVEQFGKLFDADTGKARLVLLLSPTCPVCVAGARWVQNDVLAEHPDLDVAVYAVWFDVLPTDSKNRWPSDLITDPRVVHLWDADRVLGAWYGSRLATTDRVEARGLAWDAYILYEPDARWADEPAGRVSSGATIVATREKLRRDLLALPTAQ